MKAVVAMGSKSDLPVMKEAIAALEKFGVRVDTIILSAHRTPERLALDVAKWEDKGVEVIVAGAGGAAHLPGMLASHSILPVIGVPVKTKSLGGLDSLLSIVQMPKGVPVATVAIDGAFNAGLLACEILSIHHKKLKGHLKKYKRDLNKNVKRDRQELLKRGVKDFLK
jgi:5-(carboxyamino)imidazole ribonucleotide mutase